MIVMDGATIYDIAENRYLYADAIPSDESSKIINCLNSLNISYFIYTVHGNRTCVFHHGTYSEAENKVYDRMKRSPYRSYLDSVDYVPEEIIYFKIIAEDEQIQLIEQSLRSLLSWAHLRRVLRPQGGEPGIGSLYIYSRTATIKHAKKQLMSMLLESNPDLCEVDITAPRKTKSERDAVRLLHLVERQYAPVFSFSKIKNRRP